MKKKRREKIPGEWKKAFNGQYICSYPPEDIVVEGYGKYLQKKALEIKAEENRVSMTPAGVEVMIQNGHSVLVEKGAGAGSGAGIRPRLVWGQPTPEGP